MRKKSDKHKKVWLGIIILLLILSPFILKAGKAIPVIWQVIFNKNIELKKENGNINILLLGIGGGTHDGPNLSDTIIFASVSPEKNKVSLISVPRDLYVPDLKAKVNTAYAVGELKRKGGGIVLAEAVVGKVLGQPIDYTIRIDFAGFEKAIDSLGGIDINVENSFDDYQYPLDGKGNDSCGHSDIEIASLSAQLATGSATELVAFPCRYEHLHFDKGLQHMIGVTALKYVRSRYAKGDEGTDFARSKRQERLISAVKEKVFSAGTLLNPVTIISFYGAIRDNVDANIKEGEFDDFIKLAQKLRGAKIQSTSLEFSEDPEKALLINPPIDMTYQYQYVLIPQAGNGNFSDVHNFVECKIKLDNC